MLKLRNQKKSLLVDIVGIIFEQFERSEFLTATSKKIYMYFVVFACVRLILVLVGKKIVRVFD